METVGMGIDMATETDMAVCVMSGGVIVYCKSFSDYSEFNEEVLRLQELYGIPNNKIMYENKK